MAQVRGQLPEFSIGKRPRGHTGMPDTIFEVIEKFTIAHALHISAAQVRGPRILTTADFRLASAVIRVANLALVGVDLMAGLDVCALRTDIERVFHRSEAGRDGVMQQPLGNVGLENRRILPRTRTFPYDERVQAHA